MLDIIKIWKGPIIIDNVEYASCSEIPSDMDLSCCSCVSLKTTQNTSAGQIATRAVVNYTVSVRGYMLKPSTPEFNFMEKWNNNTPMPLKTMVGTIEKETRGMYYMNLHGDILQEKMQTCMKCGRPITNPVSQYFGMGPECGGHNYVSPFESEEELKEAVQSYRLQLQNITWSGWVIKSAITELEEIKDE